MNRKQYDSEYNKAYYARNKERLRQKNGENLKKNPDTTARYFSYKLKRLYNMSLVEYQTLTALQEGLCAICKCKEKLVVDHCHTRGKVRGLLCQKCNLLLGHAKDNPQILDTAASYLRK